MFNILIIHREDDTGYMIYPFLKEVLQIIPYDA